MKRTILEAVVGSTVHGTSVKDGLEDLDLMAVMLEDQKTFAGLLYEVDPLLVIDGLEAVNEHERIDNLL